MEFSLNIERISMIRVIRGMVVLMFFFPMRKYLFMESSCTSNVERCLKQNGLGMLNIYVSFKFNYP